MNATPDSCYESQPLLFRILIRRFVYRHHPRAWGALCLAASLWLVALGGILCIYGFWWGAAVIAIAALEFSVAYRLLFVVQS
jgi:hypothetical protein